MKNKIVSKKKSGVLILLEESGKKSSESLSRAHALKTFVMLKDVPLDVRKEEASKPLYLVRYE
jgi:hypothetical protein